MTATRGHSRLLHQRVARGCSSISSLPVESTRSVWHGRLIATIQSFVLLIKTVSLSHSALSVQDFSEERGPFSRADNIINLMRSQQAVTHYLINCCLFWRRLWLQIASTDCRDQDGSRSARVLTNFRFSSRRSLDCQNPAVDGGY